jgi:hypothetical protein
MNRTSRGRSTTAALLLSLLGLLAGTVLAGCTPGMPTPTPSATTASAAATPTPRPTPTVAATAAPEDASGEAVRAARVIIFTGLIGAAAASGNSIGTVIDMFEPLSSIDPVIDELSGHFGFEPVSEFVPADPCCDGVDYTSYRWDGFEVLDWVGTGSQTPARPEFVVRATSSDVRGVRVETVDGISIGDSMTGLEAAHPSDSYRQTGAFTEQIVVRVMVMEPVEARFGPVSFAVRLTGPVSGGVDEIFSPVPDLQI